MCFRDAGGDEAAVEEMFGFRSSGVRYKTCRQCRAKARTVYKEHREEDPEWRRDPEANRENAKRYYYAHREDRLVKSKAYYETHKEAHQEYMKDYYMVHRDELRAAHAEKKTCKLCGRSVTQYKLKNHQATRLCEKNRP